MLAVEQMYNAYLLPALENTDHGIVTIRVNISEESDKQTIEAELQGMNGDIFTESADKKAAALFHQTVERLPDENALTARFRIRRDSGSET